MQGRGRGLRCQRWLAVAMLAAFLPSVLFLGHVDVHVGIPGMAPSFALLSPAADHHDGDAAGEDHGRHCHEAAASCSEVPFAGASAFLVMLESAAALGAAALLVLVFAALARPAGAAPAAPVPPPPRFAPA